MDERPTRDDLERYTNLCRQGLGCIRQLKEHAAGRLCSEREFYRILFYHVADLAKIAQWLAPLASKCEPHIAASLPPGQYACTIGQARHVNALAGIRAFCCSFMAGLRDRVAPAACEGDDFAPLMLLLAYPDDTAAVADSLSERAIAYVDGFCDSGIDYDYLDQRVTGEAAAIPRPASAPAAAISKPNCQIAPAKKRGRVSDKARRALLITGALLKFHRLDDPESEINKGAATLDELAALLGMKNKISSVSRYLKEVFPGGMKQYKAEFSGDCQQGVRRVRRAMASPKSE